MKNLSNYLGLLVTGIIAFASTAGASTNSFGAFVEPMLVYDKGDVNVNWSQATGGLLSDSKESISGLGVGARFGVHVHESVYVGLDGRYYKNNYQSSALGDSTNANAYDLGLVAGLTLPVSNDLGLRFWATYIPLGELDPGSMSGVDAKLTKLSGYRLGAGLLVSAISINLEYQDATYGSVDAVAGGVLAISAPDSVKPSEKKFILGVSMPIGLF